MSSKKSKKKKEKSTFLARQDTEKNENKVANSATPMGYTTSVEWDTEELDKMKEHLEKYKDLGGVLPYQ